MVATSEPLSIIAGDSVEFTKNVSAYSPADGWVLSYVFINQSNRYEVTATDNGDGTHLTTITAATTATWQAGDYQFFAYVIKDAERYSVSAGSLIIKPDYTSPKFDARTHVKKVLDALEAVIEEKASDDQMSLQINGRSIQFLSPVEILKFRQTYKTEYANEQKVERIKKGLSHRGKIRVRFV